MLPPGSRALAWGAGAGARGVRCSRPRVRGRLLAAPAASLRGCASCVCVVLCACVSAASFCQCFSTASVATHAAAGSATPAGEQHTRRGTRARSVLGRGAGHLAGPGAPALALRSDTRTVGDRQIRSRATERPQTQAGPRRWRPASAGGGWGRDRGIMGCRGAVGDGRARGEERGTDCPPREGSGSLWRHRFQSRRHRGKESRCLPHRSAGVTRSAPSAASAAQPSAGGCPRGGERRRGGSPDRSSGAFAASWPRLGRRGTHVPQGAQ